MLAIRLRTFLPITAMVLLGSWRCDAEEYDIDVSLNTFGSYQVLSYRVDYKATGGMFNGSGASVSCAANAALNATAAFNDLDSLSKLNASLITTGNMTGPVVLATCTMTAASPPAVEAFTITTADYDTSSPPTFFISRIQMR